jgi:23S rRNA pseudouridine2605 synthase
MKDADKNKPNRDKRPAARPSENPKARFKRAEEKTSDKPMPSDKNSDHPPSDFKKAVRPKQRFKKPKLEPIAEANSTPRLNKFLANAGIASRRAADELIKAGNVTVNDKVVLEMGYRVQPGDVVCFGGKVVEQSVRQVYILMNKPKNTITTTNDPQGRKTVMHIIKNACEERVYPVGRLDRETTGLLLLTNDGDLAKKLAHPSHRVKKIYHVILDKNVSIQDIQKISEGLALEDGLAEVDKVSYIQGQAQNEIGVEIHIGRNRIVRRIFEHLGYQVIKLDRVYYGGLTKKDVPRGMYRFLTEEEVRMLKYFV